jgi:hypothetical protein
MSESNFDPDDMTELEGIFAEMISDNEDGFVMEFGISRLAAKELVDLWYQSVSGDKAAQLSSWAEYTKIVMQLKLALGDEN